jgi:iron complex outermembrane receptor protein
MSNNNSSPPGCRELTMKAPATLGAGVCLALIAVAQEVSAQSDGFMLEEIIVTAQKRSESLQDTPISLVAFDSMTLENQGIDSLVDIAALVPSMTIEPFPTNNATLRIFIRGVGLADAQITQDPPVGVYLDGAYIARSTGLALDVAELERIEVLRGPQGTLYGRNATGGAINLITRPPTTDGVAFRQQLTAGNRDRFTAKSSLNVPLGESAAMLLSYLDSRIDGFVDNTGPGEDFGDSDQQAYRAALRWEPADSLRLDYAYDHAELKFVNYPYQPVLPPHIDPLGSPDRTVLDQIAEQAQTYVQFEHGRRSEMATPVPMLESSTRIDGHMLTTNWQAGEDLDIKLISAWRELDDEPYADLSGGSESLNYRVDDNDYTSRDGSVYLPRVPSGIDQHQQSHELQFIGQFNPQLDYILGLYYFEENATSDSFPLHHQSTSPFSVTDTGTAVASTYAVTIAGADFEVDNTARAVYGRLAWTPPVWDERLTLTLGGRYSEDERKVKRSTASATMLETQTIDKITGAASATAPATVQSNSFSARASNNYNDDSYELIGEYALQDNANVYLKYAEAYKSGGYNTREPVEEIFQLGFGQEKVSSWELGIKSEWLDRRLRVNGDVFYSSYTDIQLQFKLPGALTDARVVNAGEAEMKGLELDMDFLPIPTLLTRLSYAWLDADITEALDPLTGADVTNDFTFSSAPEHSLTAMVDWTIAEFSWSRLSLNASYSYMDDRDGSTRTDISRDIYLPSYDLVNARLSLDGIAVAGGTLTVAAWGRNLQDSEYVINGLAALTHASRSVIWGDSRTWGVDLIYRY